MNAGSGQLSMTGLPILRHANLRAAVAVDAAGSVTAARFVADAWALARQLPDSEYVVNLCADRYRFAVGFVAALLRQQVTLLPLSEAASPLAALLGAYPETYFLCDGPSAASGLGRNFLFPGQLEEEPPKEIPTISANQPAAVLFTSGSTGLPTPHPRHWGAMVNSTRAAGHALGLTKSSAGYILGTVPHQHSYGLESIVMLALQHGLAFHRARALLPGDIVAQLDGMAAPRMLVTTPIHLRSLVAHNGTLPRLDRIICATAPLAPDLARAAEARFDAPLYEIYGCSEIGQMAVRRTVESLEWKCLNGIELSTRDGDIWASGDAAATEAPVNDVIELIDAKRFVLKDRKSDVVNIAGKRSSLAFLNHHLNAIEGVLDGVFIVPEDGRRLAAYVVAPDLSSDRILAALRRQLDPAFLPRPIHFVDALPRNPTGKLTRQAMKTLSENPSAPDDGWSSASYRFAADHATAAGHFPGNPIIPGALLLDRVLHVIGRSTVVAPIQDIRVAKFLRPVRPGDSVTFRWRQTPKREIVFECRLDGSGDVALSGTVAMDAA
jgi:acyl-coenzyme A synthetase/AMP-(fatty) acid ligase/3-hydroxymyristoyl/3-hydroxydecanoyl-(acyl carrier protein) dehydratase